MPESRLNAAALVALLTSANERLRSGRGTLQISERAREGFEQSMLTSWRDVRVDLMDQERRTTDENS